MHACPCCIQPASSPFDGYANPYAGSGDLPLRPKSPSDDPLGPRAPTDDPVGPKAPTDDPLGPRAPNELPY